MSGLRLIIGLPLAALITIGLFLVMGNLIKNDGEVPVDPGTTVDKFTIGRTIEDTPDKKFKIDPTEKPDIPPVIVIDREKSTGPITDTSKPTYKKPGKDGTIDEFVVKGVPIPIVTRDPDYPARCQNSGIEGTATVKFDVTSGGEVVNVRVVSSSHRCFEKAAVKAIQGYKYNPALGGGSGIAIKNVTKKFTFTLAD